MEQPRIFHLRIGSPRCAGPSPHRPARLRRSDLPAEESPEPSKTPSLRAPMPPPITQDRATVLLIESDPEIRGLLMFSLQQQGWDVVETCNGAEALAAAVECQPQMVLLDLALQDMDAMEILQKLREWTRCHIVVISQRADEPLKLRALDSGANDFLARPFSMTELCARLRAARRFAMAASPQVFEAGKLSVDLASRTVKISDRKISLTGTEYALLALFVRNAGKVLTHAQILREIWGPKMLTRMEYLRVYLKLLREKLEQNPAEPRLLLTERGIGYRLAVPEE